LRQLDYDIEAGPHFGYRLVSSPDALHADDLLARLNCGGWGERPREPQLSKPKRLAGTLAPPRERVIGRDIQVFEQTTSTNDVLKNSRGTGCRKAWSSLPSLKPRAGGGSVVNGFRLNAKGYGFRPVAPDLRPQEATQLTVASATALRRAIAAETGLKPEIKWPNDILIGAKKSRAS